MRAELVDQPAQLRAVHGEDELVGIGKAKLDAVGAAQHMAFHALAVDIDAMPAAGVFNRVFAAIPHDPGVLARGAAVAQDQVIVGLAADFERQRREFHAGAGGAGIEDDYGGRRYEIRRDSVHQAVRLARGRCGAPASLTKGVFGSPCCRARSSSSARSDWQWAQYPPTSVRASRI